MNNFQKQLNELNDADVLYDLSFVEALYSGKRYLRCQTDKGAFQIFDIAIDSIFELQTLSEKEFMGINWDATNNDQLFKE